MENYTIRADHAPDKEIQRLDDLHDSIALYLGGRLSLAPLEQSSPVAILELGSGSGAWSIQAACQFPDAQIVAVDLKGLPRRPLPPNLVFQCLDLTKPLPFVRASFDVIHARLVMMHLPQGVDILRQVPKYLKPGGWLLIEEPDDDCFWDDEGPPGQNLQALLEAWHRSMRDRGAEPCIGRLLETELLSLDSFAEVNVHYIDIPLSGQSSVPAENRLGAGWQRAMHKVIPLIRGDLASYGITPAVIDGVLAELDDPTKKLTTRMYLTWSKKLL